MHMYKHKYLRVHTYLRMYHHHGAVRESAVSPTGTWNGMHECAHVLYGAPPVGGKETMPLGTLLCQTALTSNPRARWVKLSLSLSLSSCHYHCHYDGHYVLICCNGILHKDPGGFFI